MGLFKSKKRNFRKHRWRSLYGTHSEELYHKKRKLLDEAGIDYRVWMDANEPVTAFCRKYFEDPVKFRRHYNFYVRTCDYRKGCRALNIDTHSAFRNGIS